MAGGAAALCASGLAASPDPRSFVCLLRLPQRTREEEEKSLLTNPQPSSVLTCRLGVPRSLLGLGGACQWPGGAVLARSCPRHPLGVLLRRLLRAEQSVPEPITSTGPKQVSLRLN